MQALLAALGGLLHDSSFWSALLVIVGGVLVAPGGVASQIITALLDALDAWAKKSLPASEYEIVTRLAHDAVTYAYQYGQGQGWTNAQKAQGALDQLTATAHAHGITRFSADALKGIFEAVWLDIKPSIVIKGAFTTHTASTPAIAPTPAPTGPSASGAGTANTDGTLLTFALGSAAPVIGEDGQEHPGVAVATLGDTLAALATPAGAVPTTPA